MKHLLIFLLLLAWGQPGALAADDCSAPDAVAQALEARGQGNFPAALAVLATCVSAHPDRVDYRLELALTHAWDGDFTTAREHYALLLNRMPGYRPARLGLAWVAAWQGAYPEAQHLFKTLYAEASEDLDALTGLAFVARARLDYATARGLYRRLQQHLPTQNAATRALRQMRDTPRLSLTTHAGSTLLDDGRRIFGHRLSTIYRLRPRLSLSSTFTLAYQPDAPTPKPQGRFAAHFQTRRHGHLNAALLRRPNTVGLDLGWARPLHTRITGLLSLQLARNAESHTPVLLAAGLLVTTSARSHMLLQVFHAKNRRAYRATTYVLGAQISLGDWLKLAPGVSHRRDTFEAQWEGIFELLVQPSPRLGVGFQLGQSTQTRPHLGFTLRLAR